MAPCITIEALKEWRNGRRYLTSPVDLCVQDDMTSPVDLCVQDDMTSPVDLCVPVCA